MNVCENCTAASKKSICHVFTFLKAFKKHLGKKDLQKLDSQYEEEKKRVRTQWPYD